MTSTLNGYAVWIFVFLVGLAVGSFLNVVILRLKTKESLFWTTSHCPSCRKSLGVLDLIPLFSFLILAGRCRFCRMQIALQYPLVELGTGLLFLLVVSTFPNSFFDILFWTFFAASFVVIILFDLKFQSIPGEIVWPLVLGAIGYTLLPSLTYMSSLGEIWNMRGDNVLTGLATGGFILLLVIVTREQGMGLGDVPIAFLQGLLLGYPGGLLALGLSFIIGAVVSVFLLLSKRVTLKTAVPFTPFLIVSLLIVLFLET